MTRPVRITVISTSVIAALILIAGVSVVFVAQSDWLRETLRQKIIAQAEQTLGGRVEIGAFQLDWRTLTATVDNLTIHGSEPAGDAPLLAVKRVKVGFRIISLMQRDFNVASVQAEDPRAHIILGPDGTTNVPHPKVSSTSGTGPETILALRIGKFVLANGALLIDRTGAGKTATPWDARGENLAANVTYNLSGPRYDGVVSIMPLHLTARGYGPVDAQVTAAASMEKDRVTISAASLKTAGSQVDFSNVVVSGFTAPVTTAQYTARLSLDDADRIFKLVNFRHTGLVNVTGNIRYVSMQDYLVTGAARGTGIGYGKVRNIRVSGNVSAAPEEVLVTGLRVNALGGELRANGSVRKLEDFHLSGQLEKFDARALAGLGDLPALPWDGVISGPFDATGKLNELNYHRIKASATLTVSPAATGTPVNGEITAKYDGATNILELGHSWIELPKTRADVTGVLGKQLDVKFQSRDLNDLQPVLDPALLPAKLAAQNGLIAFDGSVTGPLDDPHVAGRATIQNAIFEGEPVDSLAGDFTAMKTGVTFNNANVTSGNMRVRTGGSVSLVDWKVVTTSALNANTQIANADVTRLLKIAGQKNVPVTGGLSANFQITGSVGDPHATADVTISKGQIAGEPFDSLTSRVQYINGGAQTATAVLDAGRKRLNATARFDHSPDTFVAGKVTFNLTSNPIALNQVALVRKREPMLAGAAQLKADGVVEINRGKFNFLDLNADVSATGLALGTRSFGDAHFTAKTTNGLMTARLESNAAKASIRGEGTVALAGDYPVNAKLNFSNLGLGALAAMAERQSDLTVAGLNLDGSAAGEITISGPAKMPDLMTASLAMTEFELRPLTVTGEARNIPNLALRNSAPIHATLSKSVIQIDSARFQAPSTNIELGGAVALNSQSPLNLRVQGNVNLALAETLNTDLMSSGELVVNASVRGTWKNPDFSGRAELQKGDFHYADFSNGLTNAQGTVLFNGSRATIQSLTAESGGGKVDAEGFAALTGGLLAFRVEAKTEGVRLRYPEGVSSVSDSDITLAGTSERSEASGTVTVRRITINPKSDISTILASAVQPLRTPEAKSGLLTNMNLDVQIETAPDVAFQTSVAQSIEADANLRLRGTAADPAVLGRVNITQGELVFFGNKYTINQGSVSFFNPGKIEPILNIDLETKARGVDVILTVTGPLNKLNVSYRSDPPLQFSDIVALLATGRTPTDPTLAVRDTGQSQSLQQIGASALIGQAIANPVAGRLQRFFGVSKIKIDPQLTGITGSPEARLTIEQQITPELLFTYISDVSSTSTQLIRVEWDFNRRWSAILTREENGYVGVDFAFRKRFK
jgi:translocation and assembly module TamB